MHKYSLALRLSPLADEHAHPQVKAMLSLFFSMLFDLTVSLGTKFKRSLLWPLFSLLVIYTGPLQKRKCTWIYVHAFL